ncbi:transmembrane amino acid transporter protein-domain-containing protein [Jimgerdemannia flammicorona]|uniref:Transmembrane amino acid transporter protein-domain-containing protein n=1 Tax=Jimgerdemannia flammicorona TaxID=994334 RepID=A0A433QYU5_9FUNG|nr:transmembrane amino acid transporter protein-domain-containing protein [Jimgerdemannia flammicorona]
MSSPSLYDPPVSRKALIHAIRPHLPPQHLEPHPNNSPGPPSPVPYHLQGASITNDIYKMHNDLLTTTLPRSRSDISLASSHHPVSATDPVLDNVAKPGGFRRFFVHSLRPPTPTPDPAPTPAISQTSTYQSFPDQELFEEPPPGLPKRTRHFLEWLAINYIFDRFAGEDLSESEGEDGLSDDENLPYGQDDLRPPSRALSERAPLLRRRSSSMGEGLPQAKATTLKSFFLLLKAFIGTGILFLPKAFSNGGVIFSAVFLWFIAAVSMFAFLLLVQCKEVITGSFGDIGGTLYGKWMRMAVLFSIGLSQSLLLPSYPFLIWLHHVLHQIGFVCGGSIFIAENLQLVIKTITDGAVVIPSKTLLLIQALLLTPLVLIRNIARLSFTALLSDVLITFGLAVLVYYDVRKLLLPPSSSSNDPYPTSYQTLTPGPDIVWTINMTYYPVFIGTAVYSFEGIGLIIPIRDAMLHPDQFPLVLAGVMTLVALVLCLIGGLGYIAYGSAVQTIALSNLPPESLVSAIRCLYAFAIILSGPLTLFPATRIVEQAVFGHRTGKHDWRVKWQKNLLRIAVVAACMVVAYLGASDLDKFISLIGSVCCTPLSFIFPALFHLKAVARTRVERIADVALCVFGVIVMIFTMSVTAGEWAGAGWW